jgi:deazaflavin-dependent oxidoreductase (nitroreductase family)
MPLSRKMARFNLRFTNRVTRHIACWAPGFALLHHVGRHSGHQYETPVNVFSADDRYVFALTYGESEWVKNVLTNGSCTVCTRRRQIELVLPERLHDPSHHLVPIPARWILRIVDVDDFLILQPAHRDPL